MINFLLGGNSPSSAELKGFYFSSDQTIGARKFTNVFLPDELK